MLCYYRALFSYFSNLKYRHPSTAGTVFHYRYYFITDHSTHWYNTILGSWPKPKMPACCLLRRSPPLKKFCSLVPVEVETYCRGVIENQNRWCGTVNRYACRHAIYNRGTIEMSLYGARTELGFYSGMALNILYYNYNILSALSDSCELPYHTTIPTAPRSKCVSIY